MLRCRVSLRDDELDSPQCLLVSRLFFKSIDGDGDGDVRGILLMIIHQSLQGFNP